MNDLTDKIKDEKLDVIVLAGQSNAEDNGKGDASDYIPDNRILLMNDDSSPHFVKTGDKSRLVLNYPAHSIVSVAEEPQNQDGKKGKSLFVVRTELRGKVSEVRPKNTDS